MIAGKLSLVFVAYQATAPYLDLITFYDACWKTVHVFLYTLHTKEIPFSLLGKNVKADLGEGG